MNSRSMITVFGIVAIALLFVQTVDAQPPLGKKWGGDRQLESTDRMGDSMNRRQRGQRPGPEMLIQRFDKNDDGRLSLDEVSGKMKQRFEKHDTDKDGFVTLDELKTAMAGRRGRRNKGGEMEKGERGKGGKGGRDADPAKFIERLDKDSDGKISLVEAPERMQDKFAQIDANGDGFVDATELKSVMDKMKMMRGGNKGRKKGRRGGDGNLNPVKPKAPPVEDFPL